MKEPSPNKGSKSTFFTDHMNKTHATTAVCPSVTRSGVAVCQPGCADMSRVLRRPPSDGGTHLTHTVHRHRRPGHVTTTGTWRHLLWLFLCFVCILYSLIVESYYSWCMRGMIRSSQFLYVTQTTCNKIFLIFTRLQSKEHLRWQQTWKPLAYRESTRTILSVTCPYSMCNSPLRDIFLFRSLTY